MTYLWYMRRRAILYLLQTFLFLYIATLFEGKTGEFLVWWNTTLIGVVIYGSIKRELLIHRLENVLQIHPLTMKHVAMLNRMLDEKDNQGKPD